MDELRNELSDIYEKAYPNDERVRTGTREEVKQAFREADKRLNESKYNAAWCAASAVLTGNKQDILSAFAMDKYDGTIESHRNEHLKQAKRLH